MKKKEIDHILFTYPMEIAQEGFNLNTPEFIVRREEMTNLCRYIWQFVKNEKKQLLAENKINHCWTETVSYTLKKQKYKIPLWDFLSYFFMDQSMFLNSSYNHYVSYARSTFANINGLNYIPYLKELQLGINSRGFFLNLISCEEEDKKYKITQIPLEIGLVNLNNFKALPFPKALFSYLRAI